ncbi:METACASPASE-1-LIKE [Salix viminalis]|uniref:METACASPASE-1-LIKE n=1 Tax=Salix viminalis TaxID=40686 RepID=A0A9Q0NLW6_SALVM|nr:METACASPASE-1-LIKE [Salix viminalis]
MYMVVNCSNCHTLLYFPPGANSNYICCAVCHAFTYIADPRSAPPPPAPSYWSSSHHQHYPPPRRPFSIGGSIAIQSCATTTCCPWSKACCDLCGSSSLNPPSSCSPRKKLIPYRRPTKSSMRLAMSWLVQGCRPGDSLVFHFSGHGSQQKDSDGDELDGYDETLCPTDFETEGMIVDDEINAVIVRPLSHGVKLHAIIDACHSGTVLDLPFLCRMDKSGDYVWEDHRPRSGAWKGTSGGEVISFSGCDDDQISAETSALSKITSTGAMTYSFIQAIESGHGNTYGSMLKAMRTTIHKKINEPGGGKLPSLLSMLLPGGFFRGGIRQEPQLTANEQFDVYSKHFSL